MNHWGSDQGITVLKQLSQLYMFLIWETIVLETVIQSETSDDEAKIADKDLEIMKASMPTNQEEPLGKDGLLNVYTVPGWGGVLPTCIGGYMGRLCLKGVLFFSLQYIKG